jgi:Tfp pilus assembly protein PilZ
VTPGPPGGVERRKAPRTAPDQLSEPVSVVGARLLDVSAGGALIDAPVPLASGSTLHVRLVVGGVKTELETRVTGCRRLHGSSRPWGVGLEFSELPKKVSERLERLLSTRRRHSLTG